MRANTAVRMLVVFFGLFFASASFVSAKEPISNKVVVTEKDSMFGVFFINGRIGDSGVIPFVIDTGAYVVVISRNVADRLNLPPPIRAVVSQTAAGPVPSYLYMVPSVTAGTITVNNVELSVLPEGVEMNLLGLSFLKKLKRMELKGGIVTLEQ